MSLPGVKFAVLGSQLDAQSSRVFLLVQVTTCVCLVLQLQVDTYSRAMFGIVYAGKVTLVAAKTVHGTAL